MKNGLPIHGILRASSKLLGAGIVVSLSLLGVTAVARGQALPAAEASPISTGFSIPTVGGSLRYAISASQSLDWGYYTQSGVAAGTNLSGDVAYLSQSRYHPFSLVLAGGRTFGYRGEPSFGYANMGLSQIFNVGRWNFTLSDGLSYLPSTATGGVSGVAGAGDLGVPPTQVGPDTGQGILTNYSPQVSNTSGGSVQRQITGKTAINASGSYGILRFLNGSNSTGSFGLQADTVVGTAGLSHRLDARNTFGANFAYSSYIFLMNRSQAVPAQNFVSETASFTYTRQVSRRLQVNVDAGPQWIKLNSGTSTGLSAYADASANYMTEHGRMSLAYVRSTNSGWGVVGGTLSDSATFQATRLYGRVLEVSANVAWTHSGGLPTPNAPPFNFQTELASFQVSRALGRSFSGYASYMVENQSHAASNGTIDLFDGLNQVLGFGVTYSPASRQFGR